MIEVAFSPVETSIDAATYSARYGYSVGPDAQGTSRRTARAYTAEQKTLSFSLITRYEILRGLTFKQASAQLRVFELFCGSNQVLEVTDRVVVVAATIYADLRARGQLIPDADLLIAATALENNLVLATNNVSDFARVAGLEIDNWMG